MAKNKKPAGCPAKVWHQKAAPKAKARKRKVTEGPKVEARWVLKGPNLQQVSSKDYTIFRDQLQQQYVIDAPDIDAKLKKIVGKGMGTMMHDAAARMMSYCTRDIELANIATAKAAPNSISVQTLVDAWHTLADDGNPGPYYTPYELKQMGLRASDIKTDARRGWYDDQYVMKDLSWLGRYGSTWRFSRATNCGGARGVMTVIDDPFAEGPVCVVPHAASPEFELEFTSPLGTSDVPGDVGTP